MELNHGTREAFLQSKLENWQKVRGGGVGDEILHIKGVGENVKPSAIKYLKKLNIFLPLKLTAFSFCLLGVWARCVW